jgi:hypothetical protein
MAEVVPTGAGNPKQPNVGDSRTEHFSDAALRAHQEVMNPGPDSENIGSMRSAVEDTRAGLKAAREYNANLASPNDQVLGKGKPNPPSGQLSSDNGR